MAASPGSTAVAFAGLGNIGRPMALALTRAGWSLTVYDPVSEKADGFADEGVFVASSPEELSSCEVLVLAVPDDAAVESLLEGPNGWFASAGVDRTVVVHSTVMPATASRLAEAASDAGVGLLDAPVSGGDVGARNATLSIMVGGEAEAVEAVRPLFECMGKTIVHQGPAGAGQHTKMVNQVLIASGMIGVCEALLYAYRAGLDPEAVLASVGGGAAGSWSLSNYGPRLLRGDLEPGFRINHFIKDLGIALAEARRMDLALPGLALAEQLYVAARGQGLGDKGTQALLVALAAVSGIGPGDLPGS